MKKIYLISIIVVAVAFAIFFFPKDAGGTCGFCYPGGIHKWESGCIGVKWTIIPTDCADCGANIACFGIPMSDKVCYSGDVEVPCDIGQGFLAYCDTSENSQTCYFPTLRETANLPYDNISYYDIPKNSDEANLTCRKVIFNESMQTLEAYIGNVEQKYYIEQRCNISV